MRAHTNTNTRARTLSLTHTHTNARARARSLSLSLSHAHTHTRNLLPEVPRRVISDVAQIVRALPPAGHSVALGAQHQSGQCSTCTHMLLLLLPPAAPLFPPMVMPSLAPLPRLFY